MKKPSDYQECNCCRCERKECIHRGAYRRLPQEIGGLGLCPNLKAKGQWQEPKEKNAHRLTRGA